MKDITHLILFSRSVAAGGKGAGIREVRGPNALRPREQNRLTGRGNAIY